MVMEFKNTGVFLNYYHYIVIYYSYKIIMWVKYGKLIQKVIYFKDCLIYLNGIVMMVLFHSFFF